VSINTAVDLMRATVETHGDREAIVDGDGRLTFAEWDRAADGVASALADRGVHKGDVVCLQLPSSIGYAVCYQAAMRLGAITSGVNPRLGPAEVAGILEQARPRVVITEGDDIASWCELSPPARRPSLDPADPVAIVWTSGTTGRPKGAVFDHDNLAAMARGAGVLSAFADRRLSPLPFAHVAYMTRVWDELERAITTVITPTPWKAADALRLIEGERVTVAQGVPTQWSLMLSHPDMETTDVSSLRLASTGATTVPAELVRRMRKALGCPVVVRYTSTEASLTTGTGLDDGDDDVARTVGCARDGVEVQVVGDDGEVVPAGVVGRVRCRSGAVMRGYWNDPGRTAAVLDADGWLTLGDLGSLDDRGYLTLVGRESEMYIRGGYNVHPAQVENVLAEHPGVARAAVVGMPDAVLGQVGAAWVVCAPGASPTAGELRAWVLARLADYKVPDRVTFVDDLPLTSMLKTDKRKLERTLAHETRRTT
jgi:acyl-CoA synthetase (AMP-forming)/AMP-acid ligase II